MVAAVKNLAAPAGRTTAAVAASALMLNDAQRVTVVRNAMGHPDGKLGAFPAGIRQVVFSKHARYVQPLIEKHWPGSLQERAGIKLRFLTCNLYATAPYTVLFSAQPPPWPVALSRSVGTGLRLSPTALSSLSGTAVRLISALLPETTHRRILQIGAFIATIDHVYDHCLDGVEPVERGRRMHGLLDGSWRPDDDVPHAGAFRLVRALHEEMSANINDAGDRREFDRVIHSLREYVDAEVKAMTRVPDPSGNSWRLPGIFGTIDGLIFPVWRCAGEKARQWMYDVSLFVQVLDDFIDAEKDADNIRSTPILTGHWDESTLISSWAKTIYGLTELAKESGGDDEAWLYFVIESYRLMALETAEAMGIGTAD